MSPLRNSPSRHGFALHSIGSLALALALLFAGCTATRFGPSSDSGARAREVERRLGEIFRAAEEKDFARLDACHLYGPSFTKFASGPGGRMGAGSARQGEHDGLRAVTGLKLRPTDLKIDLFDDTAVATFLLEAAFQGNAGPVIKRERGTLVLVRHSGSWKIVHEHFSPAS